MKKHSAVSTLILGLIVVGVVSALPACGGGGGGGTGGGTGATGGGTAAAGGGRAGGSGGGTASTGGGTGSTGGGTGSTGGGTGSTGGGTGSTGGGTGTGCATVALAATQDGAFYSFHQSDGGIATYQLPDGGLQPAGLTEVDIRLPTTAGIAGPAYLTLELYYDVGAEPAAPFSIDLMADFAAGSTFGVCADCVQIYTNDALFFATRGTVSVTQANYVEMGGSLKASGTGLHFVEWDYDGANDVDQPTANGRCIDVTTAVFDGGW